MTTSVHFSKPPRPGAYLVGTVLLLLAAAGGVSYVGTREAATPEAPSAPPPRESAVERIDLPVEAFPVPYAEDREAFVASCVQCHSPRLVFTQPKFPAKKWAEIVAKMANAYKAPLSPEDQKKIVAYLSVAHGE